MRLLAASSLLLLTLGACAPEPDAGGGPAMTRRLTDAQYRQALADVFGADLKLVGKVEPDVRSDGLVAIGTAAVSVTPAGFEQYDAMARSVAAQVLAPDRRSALPCQPAVVDMPDDACAGQFLGATGRHLFRRKLAAAELAHWQAIAAAAATRAQDFHAGLEVTLAAMLVAPDFLFRIEATEPDPAHAGARRLTAASRATRLSYLLWNAAPDETLLQAAETGALDSRAGMEAQVERMLANPRMERGLRAFFTDFLGFDRFETLVKDTLLYPKYTQRLADEAREQTLRTAVDHVLTRRADYRDLFTTRHSFMTRRLGMVYDVPVQSRDGWEAYEFPADDPRTGLLTQVSFVALHSHPGRTSPTLRGKAVRELLLCQPVPQPPNNVDFAVVEETNNPQFKTARGRLGAHSADPTCAGCHKIMDPIGLALEAFDGVGEMRGAENGEPIDASGELDGRAFADAAGLGRAVRDNPATASCLVDSLYRYGVGYTPRPASAEWLAWLQGRFAADGYRVPALLRRIALSDEFYRIEETHR